MREEEEKLRKKLEDEQEEDRIRRENEEFARKNGIKSDKLESRNLNLSMATERDKKKGNTGVSFNAEAHSGS